MGFYHGVMTFIMLVVSIAQYIIYDNWQAAMYFLVAAGFYAMWSSRNLGGNFYHNCVINFGVENNKPEKFNKQD